MAALCCKVLIVALGCGVPWPVVSRAHLTPATTIGFVTRSQKSKFTGAATIPSFLLARKQCRMASAGPETVEARALRLHCRREREGHIVLRKLTRPKSSNWQTAAFAIEKGKSRKLRNSERPASSYNSHNICIIDAPSHCYLITYVCMHRIPWPCMSCCIYAAHSGSPHNALHLSSTMVAHFAKLCSKYCTMTT